MDRTSTATSLPNPLTLPPRYPAPAEATRFSVGLYMPVQVHAVAQLSELNAPGGARLLLDGTLVLSGLSAVLSFSNEADGFWTHERWISAEVMLIPPGEWFAIFGQAPGVRAARESRLRLQFHDDRGAPLGEAYETALSGEKPVALSACFRVPITVTLEITGQNRSIWPNAPSTIGGRLEVRHGIAARCVLQGGSLAPSRSRSLVHRTDVDLVAAGQPIRFPDQLMPARGHARRVRALAFRDGHGSVLGSRSRPDLPRPYARVSESEFGLVRRGLPV